MSVYTITLAAPNLPTLTIGVGGSFGLKSLDLGFPQIRQSEFARPDADGIIDETTFIGKRLITADIVLFPGTWLEEQSLRAFMSPQTRASMLITTPDNNELVTTVRGASLSAPIVLEDETAGVKRINAQWSAALGVLESAEVKTGVIPAAGSTLPSGRVYDLVFDRDYPDAGPSGSATITNAGTQNAYPVVKIYGPCVGPRLVNVSQGHELDFPGLTILAGEFLEIDLRAKTIRYNGDPADSRYNTLDFTLSTWWGLTPGPQQVRFIPDTFSLPSQAQITWRDAWI